MLSSVHGESPKPKLRGLDPSGLLGTLGAAKIPRPHVPGWQIVGIAGEGGFGLVWRARSEKVSASGDVPEAAIKIAPPSELDTIERIEAEASALRALDHPHIVRLLETGLLVENEASVWDGGLYLAMQFVEGSSLAHRIPLEGMQPREALEIFHQIASAIAHAHDRGVLHRDLKPANVLVAAQSDGGAHAMVADFGLSRPVHQRVQALSLTETGVVAGTAEYLPPEAYRGDYRPAVSTDIYALGVILYEMLSGAPPRGAWTPVSQLKQVDVRLDDLLKKALHPDVSQRFASVHALIAGLREIESTPQRYSGTPKLTPAVRMVDAMWTVIGIGVCLAAVGMHLRLTKSRFTLGIDLIGSHGLRTGTFQAVFYLLFPIAFLCLWTLLRSWHFRAVPRREALPIPFGIRAGSNRVSAVVAVLGQFFCLLLPVGLLVSAWLIACSVWLRPGDPVWREGLVVTDTLSMKWEDPWKTGAKGRRYWLRESVGMPGEALARQIDRVDIFPGVVPWIMSSLAAVSLLSLGGVLVLSVVYWGGRSRVPIAAFALVTGGSAAWSMMHFYGVAIARASNWERLPDFSEHRYSQHLLPSQKLVESLYVPVHASGMALTLADMEVYGPSVDWRGHVASTHEAILQQLREEVVESTELHREWRRFHYYMEPGKTPGSFINRYVYVEFFESPEANAGANLFTLVHEGVLLAGGGCRVDRETLERNPIYRAVPATLLEAEAAEWVREFHMLAGHAATDWEILFAPQVMQLLETWRAPEQQQHLYGRDAFVALLARAFEGHSFPVFSGELEVVKKQPGGRSRITWKVRDQHGGVHRWQADLIRMPERWVCVQLQFFTSPQPQP